MRKDERHDLLSRGISLQRARNFTQAEHCYQMVLQAHPKDPDANNLMGTLAVEAGDLDRSIAYIGKAVRAQPKETLYRNNLANSLLLNGAPLQAIVHLKKALGLKPDFMKARLNLGKALRASGDYDGALVQFNLILGENPQHYEALTGKAQVLLDKGDSSQAVSLFRSVIAKKPDAVDAFVGLSSAYKFSANDPELEQIKTLLDRPHLTKLERQALYHAAGKICDDLERYDEAFAHFQAGKSLIGQNFDPHAHAQHYDRLKKLFNEELFATFTNARNEDPRPVFVIGMPRSGTTLVEQILSSHQTIHGAGEITDLRDVSLPLFENILKIEPGFSPNTMSGGQIKQVAKLYLERLQTYASGAERIVNKTPHNFELLGLIGLLFSQAKIIHCVRDPMDTCISCFTHTFNGHHGYNADLEKLGLYYLDYQMLMAHWKQVLPLPIFEVRYEELVNDQETISRALIDFVDLEWDPACLDYQQNERVVLTPSRWQVRQPLYTSSIGRYQRYDAHLEPLKNIFNI